VAITPTAVEVIEPRLSTDINIATREDAMGGHEQREPRRVPADGPWTSAAKE
jgi:hypothetical protein